MKKKAILVSIAAVIVILAVATVGTTLAWFTDTDSAKNTFVIGSVEIVQHEQEHDSQGQLTDFTQDQVLLPIVNVAAPAQDANYVEKLVTVENTGNNDAYVRTFIAYPTVLENVLQLDTVQIGATYWAQDSVSWPQQEVDGVTYSIISYTYMAKLQPGETTPEVLLGVYLDSAVDVKENPNNNNTRQFCTVDDQGVYTFYDFDIDEQIQVLVATQGGQADGFTGYDAIGAINQMFGTADAPDLSQVQ